MTNAVLSDPHKEVVKAWVPRLREILEDDFDAQLKRLGFRRDGKHTDEAKLALPPVHPVVTAIVVLAPYGVVFLGATLALGVGEASAAVSRVLRRG